MGSLERQAEELVVEMFFCTPTTGITDATFRNETMDMRIPFEVTPKGMKNTDKTRSKAVRFIVLIEAVKDNTANCREKTIKERAIL